MPIVLAFAVGSLDLVATSPVAAAIGPTTRTVARARTLPLGFGSVSIEVPRDFLVDIEPGFEVAWYRIVDPSRKYSHYMQVAVTGTDIAISPSGCAAQSASTDCAGSVRAKTVMLRSYWNCRRQAGCTPPCLASAMRIEQHGASCARLRFEAYDRTADAARRHKSPSVNQPPRVDRFVESKRFLLNVLPDFELANLMNQRRLAPPYDNAKSAPPAIGEPSRAERIRCMSTQRRSAAVAR